MVVATGGDGAMVMTLIVMCCFDCDVPQCV